MANKDDIAARRARLSAAQRELLESVLRRGKNPEAEGQSIPRRAGTGPAPLSFAQQRLWFLNQLDPDSPFYNISRKFTLKGPANLRALERSLNTVVERHEALRTDFQIVDGEPSQVIVPHRPLTIPLTDLSGLPGPVRASEVPRLASEQARSPFTLERGPLLRASLLRLAADEHVLLLTMHHIISDGWSMGVLFRELSALYAAFAAGESPELPPLPVQYADYALWQRHRLQGDAVTEPLAYWKQQLAGAQPKLELPTTKGRPTVQGHRGGRLSVSLGKPLSDALRAFSARQGVTLFMMLVAAFKSLLWRYTGQADIVVGTPTANRNHPNLEGLIGFFANTLVLRSRVSGEASFAALLQDVRQVCVSAYANQDVPFEKLVEELQSERSLSDTPLFRVMFALENASGESLHLRGLEVKTEAVDAGTAIFDLTLYVEERHDELTVTLQYNSELFDAATITRLLTHYRRALESHVENPGRALNETPLLSATEREQLLSGWNQTRREYPAHSCIHELFEAQAAATPEGVAVIYEDERLTYQELNASANQLGHYLQELGVAPDARVGLLLERSPALITTLLAVLKAGGAYLPLSPDSPPQRLGLMLEDADAKLLITERRLASRLPTMKARLLFLEDALQEAATRPSSSPDSAATAENLAYVIYTSGSTGTPKGVMVTHRNVARLVKGSDYAELNAGETLLQFAPVAFDASTFEIWGALLNGARLAVFAPGMPSVAELCAGLRRYGVTTLWLTAGLFHQVVEEKLADLRGLRQLLAGGDVLSLWHVREALRGLEGVRLINGYGPTEGTTFTCCHVITDEDDIAATVPIGHPIANTRVYVLDDGLRLLPVGVVGELYVGGDGLARGYLKRPEFTAERFVPDSFSTEPGARLYRTGDRVRWLEGGVLEFLSRTDTQVKLRGFRIELGEVEAALCSHPSVREAVVLLRENDNGDKLLVAYVVTEAERAMASTMLRDFLKSKLPDYMAPSSYVVLEQLPLTPNGKVDRRALPAVDGEAAGGAREYVAPREGTEQRVAAIWEQVLQREGVGARDNFFELGGHSLLATRVVSHVRKQFGVELSLRRLFDTPTVEALAREIERALTGGERIGAAQLIRRAPREGRRLQPSSADD